MAVETPFGEGVENHPFPTPDPDKHDPRGVRYTVPKGEAYLTTVDLAHELIVGRHTVWKWCKQWFGELPPGRSAKHLGYRIPLEYVLVGRAWMVEKDPELRRLAWRAILTSPRNFVLVVGKRVTMHYTLEETSQELLRAYQPNEVVRIYQVGPYDRLNDQEET